MNLGSPFQESQREPQGRGAIAPSPFHLLEVAVEIGELELNVGKEQHKVSGLFKE